MNIYYLGILQLQHQEARIFIIPKFSPPSILKIYITSMLLRFSFVIGSLLRLGLTIPELLFFQPWMLIPWLKIKENRDR